MKNSLKKSSSKFTLIALGTAAVLFATAACSSSPKPAAKSAQPASASFHPAVYESAASKSAQPTAVALDETKLSVVKPPASKLMGFKSRDYGVSFQYPWQYAFYNAKTIAKLDDSMKPKSDGNEGQFTLATVEIPAGFYPDSDFERGYLTLSLNQDLDQEACAGSLGATESSKVQTENINGVDFQWVESEAGGRGSATKLRNYIAYSNGTCYEVQMGVSSKNERGMAKEVNHEQVMQRLDSILRTVKLSQPPQAVATQQLESSNQ
jgi:hypothetical protein